MKQLYSRSVAVALMFLYAFVTPGFTSGVNATEMVQGTRVSGVVQDETGAPLPGVTVSAVSITTKQVITGAYTDASGRFSLTLPSTEGIIIRFTSVGFKAQEAEPGDNLSIVLTEDYFSVEETVVTGYGSLSRTNLTGSVGSLGGDEIANLPVGSFDQAISGRFAGVYASQSDGLVGTIPRIRVRGINSINGAGDPLIVIDGVPYSTGDNSGVGVSNALIAINPADIERYDVLKDAAATALYGSRGTNGVIVITTKRGAAGRSKVDYTGTFGWLLPRRRLEVLNAEEFIEYKNEALNNAGFADAAFPLFIDGELVDTDWQDEIYRESAFVQTHNLGISGGSESTTYRFSLGYTNQEQFVIGSGLERGTFGGTVDHKVNKWLKAGGSIFFSRQRTDLLNTGSNSVSGNAANALQSIPNVPVRNPDGSFAVDPTNPNRQATGNNLLPSEINSTNIAFVLATSDQYTNELSVRTTGFLAFEPITGLVARLDLGVNFLQLDDYLYWSPLHGDGFTSNGIAFRSNFTSTRTNFKGSLSYTRTIGEHDFNVAGYYESQDDKSNSIGAQGEDFIDPSFRDVITGTFITPTVTGGLTRVGFVSWLGLFNYAYNDRYLLQASYRSDALSRLSPDFRRGEFYGVGAGWIVSEENFFSGISNTVNFLKIKASFGQTGNDRIPGGNFAYQGSFAGQTYGSQGGSVYNSAANPALTWETSDKYDVGFELGLFDDRIRVTSDYFFTDNNGLVFSVPTAPSAGIPGNTIPTNIGSSRSEGVELAVQGLVFKNQDWNVSVDLNFTYTQSVVTSLPSGPNQYIFSGASILNEGNRVGAFFTLPYIGANPANGFPVYSTRDRGLIQYNVFTGTWSRLDDGTSTGAPNTSAAGNDDRVVVGQPNPTYFGGAAINASYKDFYLQSFFTYALGYQVYNASADILNDTRFINNGQFVLDRWQEEGDLTSVPIAYYDDTELERTSSRFFENGNFLRLSQLEVGYRLPKEFISVLGLESARVFFQGTNLFIITNYTGVDPEANSNGNVNVAAGVDGLAQPFAATYMFGINLTF